MASALIKMLGPIVVKFLENEASKIPGVNQQLVDVAIEAVVNLVESMI